MIELTMGQVKTIMTTKHKHLTLSERNDIQMGIEQKKTFRAIAQLIGKDTPTVSKEVRKHLTIKESSKTQKCESCPLLKRLPYVCSDCPKKRIKCGFTKQFYYTKRAQVDYERNLSENHEGIALNKPEFYDMDNTISEAIKKGQHINHIITSNDLPASRTSIYRYIDKDYISINPIDLPRAVKFKKRRTIKLPPIPKLGKEGRTYQDFQATLLETETSSWLEW